MIKLSDFVMKFVVKAGVKDIFLLSGGGCMHLVDSVGRNKDLNYVCCLHEQVASFAAVAYGQYTNNLGVALVTTGPGGTNAITGVAAAWTDSIPLLVLSGQVKRPDISVGRGLRTFGFQELDIVSVVKPITKYAATIFESNQIRSELEKACFIAQSGRPGPVWLDIPLDVQAALIDEAKLKSFVPKKAKPVKSLPKKVKQIISWLKKSKRPVVIAGYGIKVSGAEKDFVKLIEKLNIPVLTTWKALDLLPEDHPLFFGRPGCIGQRGANFIQQNADLVITIGARLDYGQIGFDHKTFAREAKKVVVDVEAAELDKFKFKLDLAVKSSAADFILELLKESEPINCADWLKLCLGWKKRYPVVLPEHWAQKKYASTYALIDTLSKLSAKADLFVPENSGAASEIVMQALRLQAGQRVITMNTLGSMGSGLPASIGASVASRKKRVISVIGDGSLQMNVQDLETVARLKLPIKYFILNNDGYGSIKNTQRNYFKGLYVGSDPTSGVTLPATAKIAVAYQIKYFKISKNSEITKKVKEALAFSGPVLCEVMVDPVEATSPKLQSQVKPDGSMVSKSLEDLWPFLDRAEFTSNMIVNPLDE